jgi:steroid 5-alpha reductase family enzyme
VAPAGLLLLATLLAAFLMAATFAVARRIDNYSIVDVAWSANFTPIAWLYAALAPGYLPRRLLVAGLVTLWSLRLALHLHRRIAAQHPVEDGRYQELRRAWTGRLATRFFLFFQAQGLLNALLSIPFLLACLDRRGPLDAKDAAGASLFAVALAGEAAADRQLARWKRDPARRGGVCDVGLWGLSRHPNYFFEWLVWVAFALLAVRAPWGAGAVFAPLLMLYFLLSVTGIPATEAQALRSRGEAYRDYQRRVSAFFPWRPRR